jgi:hypothetical protein
VETLSEATVRWRNAGFTYEITAAPNGQLVVAHTTGIYRSDGTYQSASRTQVGEQCLGEPVHSIRSRVLFAFEAFPLDPVDVYKGGHICITGRFAQDPD